MGNIVLQIERTSSGMLAPGDNVIFETVSHSTGNISYDNTAGTVTFLEAGRYLINWCAVIQASSYVNGALFACSASNGELVTGNLNAKTGQVTGVGIINIAAVPATLSLKNMGTGSYYYSTQVPLKAALVITRDDEPVNMRCFAIEQLSHVFAQMIIAYSAFTWTIYTTSLYSFSGMPWELYTAPDAVQPSILRLIDSNNDYEAVPLEHITAVYPGDGTVYDPAFTYLTPPDPLPPSCDSALLAAIQSYLPVGTDVALNMGPSVSASGTVYRNECGLLVLSDADGNTPIFIPALNILRIFLSGDSTQRQPSGGNTKPDIRILNPEEQGE